MPSGAGPRRWPCATPAWAGCPAAAFWQGWRIRLPAGGCAGRDHPSWAKSMPLRGPWAARASGCCTAPMPSAARPWRMKADEGPVLRRTLDWPFPGLGRLVEVARQRGAAGDFLSVTWPGFAGLLTAVAPGRFAASINQAPMRRRTRVPLAAVARLRAERHRSLLRQRASAARASVACRLRDLCGLRRGPSLSRGGAGCASGAVPRHRVCARRARADRARDRRAAHLSRRHRRRQRVARQIRRLAAARVRRGQADGKQSSPHGRDVCLDRPPSATPGLGDAARRECLHARHRRNVRRHRPTARLRMGSARRQRDAGDRRDGGRGTFRRCQARFFAAAPRGRWRARYWPV